MEVRIDTYVEESDGTRRMINRAYEVMVHWMRTTTKWTYRVLS